MGKESIGEEKKAKEASEWSLKLGGVQVDRGEKNFTLFFSSLSFSLSVSPPMIVVEMLLEFFRFSFWRSLASFLSAILPSLLPLASLLGETVNS